MKKRQTLHLLPHIALIVETTYSSFFCTSSRCPSFRLSSMRTASLVFNLTEDTEKTVLLIKWYLLTM